jgi:hypothetical protein
MTKTVKLSIHEALAEIKLIKDKIEKTQAFIAEHLYRPSDMVDPLKEGSEIVVKRRLQSIHDLAERALAIRAAINKANIENTIKIKGTTRTIAEWLIWKRETLVFLRGAYNTFYVTMNSGREQSSRQAYAKHLDIEKIEMVYHLDPEEVLDMRNGLTEIMSLLDGQLSLKNAQIKIEISE